VSYRKCFTESYPEDVYVRDSASHSRFYRLSVSVALCLHQWWELGLVRAERTCGDSQDAVWSSLAIERRHMNVGFFLNY